MIADYTIRLQDRFTNTLGGMENRLNRFESAISKTQGSVNSFGASFAGGFAGGFIAQGISTLTDKIKELGMESINTAREFSNLKGAIEFASGPAAQQNIQFLNDTIDRLGLDMQSTYKGFKTFQGALMGTALEGDKGREIFTAVSEAATVMKLSAEQSEGAFLALGQMISKGNVSAEELRGQLGERLPGAFQIFARSLGVSTQKLDAMLKKGEVVAVDTLPLFAAELRRTFGSGVSKAQQDFNANWNRFNNFIYQAKINLGNNLIPLVNQLITLIPRLDFSPLLLTFRQLGSQIGVLYDQFNQLLDLFGAKSLTAFEKLTIALRYVSFSFRVAWTPIRGLIQLYSQLISLVKNSIDIFEGFGTALVGVLTFDFDKIKQGTAQFKNGFKKLADDAGNIWSNAWQKEKEGWQSIFAPLNDDSKGANAAGFGVKKYGQDGMQPGLSGTGKTKEAGVEKIASGTRNVTINIQNLIKEVAFQKYDGSSEAKMMDYIRRALLTAVNDVNIQPQ